VVSPLLGPLGYVGVTLAFIWPTLLVIGAAIFFAGWGVYNVMT
jgi:hypothetical protein